MSEMILGKDDLIRRQDAIKALEKWKEGEARTIKDYGEVFVLGRTSAFADAIAAMVFVPSAEPEDWMERNKERILQAGMEGREIEFRIGGRLFAIREKAQ